VSTAKGRTTKPASTPTRSFDAFAETFDRFAELVGAPLAQYVEGALPAHGARAVDLGCGTGRHATLLASRYREVLGVDVSESMLQVARARRNLPGITYQQRDLCTLTTAADGRFDLVFSAYTLHHVPDLDATLQRIRELVAPGGLVVLIDNVAPRPAVPRRWFVGEAVRLLALDLLRRRRPPAEAFEVFRLNTNRQWLDHLTTDRFLDRSEFERRYGRAFPGARFTSMYRAHALRWDAPGPGGEGSEET